MKIDSEDFIQSQIYRWFNNNYCLNHHNPKGIIFSVPNGGYRNKAEAQKLKATGLTSGVSDLILVYNNQILFLEVKEPTKGSQSPNQAIFQNTISQAGFTYIITTSLDDAMAKIKSFFSI